MALNVREDARSDADLITAVRAGDREAYGTLFARHREAASRLARQLDVSAADDLVAESFARVLGQLEAGKGPTLAFRAYLLTSLRHVFVDQYRRGQRERVVETIEDVAPIVDFVDTAEIGFDRSATARAFSSLPERWQAVLWHIDVEGAKPADVAPLLGMTPNGVSALVYRAREGLRQAYLQNHLSSATPPMCQSTIGLLGAYVRGGASARDAAKVDAHIDTCRSCLGLVLELRETNSRMGAYVALAVLGPAAIRYAGIGSAPGIAPPPVPAFAPVAMAVGTGVAGVAVAVSATAFVHAAGDGSRGDRLDAARHQVTSTPSAGTTLAAPPTSLMTPGDAGDSERNRDVDEASDLTVALPEPPVAPPVAPPTVTIPTVEPTPVPQPTQPTAQPTPRPSNPTATTPTPTTPTPTTPTPTIPTPTAPTETTPTEEPPLPEVMPLSVGEPEVQFEGSDRWITFTLSSDEALDPAPRQYSVVFTFDQPAGIDEPGAFVVDPGSLFEDCSTFTAHELTCTLTISPGETRTGTIHLSDSDEGGSVSFISDDASGENASVALIYPSVR